MLVLVINVVYVVNVVNVYYLDLRMNTSINVAVGPSLCFNCAELSKYKISMFDMFDMLQIEILKILWPERLSLVIIGTVSGLSVLMKLSWMWFGLVWLNDQAG
jgi:hypothetical protein